MIPSVFQEDTAQGHGILSLGERGKFAYIPIFTVGAVAVTELVLYPQETSWQLTRLAQITGHLRWMYTDADHQWTASARPAPSFSTALRTALSSYDKLMGGCIVSLINDFLRLRLMFDRALKRTRSEGSATVDHFCWWHRNSLAENWSACCNVKQVAFITVDKAKRLSSQRRSHLTHYTPHHWLLSSTLLGIKLRLSWTKHVKMWTRFPLSNHTLHIVFVHIINKAP